MAFTITPSERLQLVGLAAILIREEAIVGQCRTTARAIVGEDATDHLEDAVWGDSIADPEAVVDQALDRAGIEISDTIDIT